MGGTVRAAKLEQAAASLKGGIDTNSALFKETNKFVRFLLQKISMAKESDAAFKGMLTRFSKVTDQPKHPDFQALVKDVESRLITAAKNSDSAGGNFFKRLFNNDPARSSFVLSRKIAKFICWELADAAHGKLLNEEGHITKNIHRIAQKHSFPNYNKSIEPPVVPASIRKEPAGVKSGKFAEKARIGKGKSRWNIRKLFPKFRLRLPF
ncbi:MAG: hypothetical protein ABIH00_07315 [Armatimonadota bacterium]